MKTTRTKLKIAGLLITLVMLVATFSTFAVTAFATDGEIAAVTVIEGYGYDSYDSEFDTVSGNEIISDTYYNGTSWIDDIGKGNLYFQWGYGDTLDVTLIDRDGVVSYESVIIQEHSDSEKRDDVHWMEFPLPGAYTDDTYIVATHGFDEYMHNEDFTTGTGSVANIFTQTSSGDSRFLSNYMLMYGEDYITDGSTSLSFKHIPATFRFVITNTHGKALFLESVTLRVVDADGNSVPVASQYCEIYMDALVGYKELTYSNMTYDSITTNLSSYTLEVGESYLAYALALPLQSDDALTDKTIHVEVTTSEGKYMAFELAADALSNANPGNAYNWVGSKSYTFRMGTRCADGCALDAAGKCCICGYQCDHDNVKYTDDGGDAHTKTCAICDAFINFDYHTGGTATCQSQAVCVACGASYGDLNPDNHISVDIEMGLCSCGYQFEARIGDTPYVTFEDAFLAASTGDTVVAYAGRSGGNLLIPKGVIFNGGEYEFSTMTENRGEIIGGKYTGNTINYGKITGGLFEGNRFVVSNYGEITGGTFNIYVEHYSGKLTGGIFNIFVAAHANIDGGHFTESSGIDFYADMDTGIFYVVINGGVFDCDLTAFTNIYGGEFNGEVINCSEIFGGVFNGEVINSRGKIFDGEFNGKVTNGVLAENGMLDRNGFILGGIFNSEILNYSHIYNLVDDDYTFILGENFVMTYVNGRITCEEHIKASDATCTAQAICRICGSYGELLDHSWTDATCETPKTCLVCNLTEGEALGHDYADATCETPKTCKICNATEGEALGHDYADATCETPKTCKICNATEGEVLGHDFADATTEAPKTCKNCGATEGEPLSKPEEPNWLMKIINAILDFLKKLFVIK